MRSADFRRAIVASIVVLIGACSSAPKEPPPPRPIPGYVRPPAGDSVIKDGPFAGRILELVCDPDLNMLESGDVSQCILRAGLVQGSITTFTHLDSFPDIRIANPNILTVQREGSVIGRAPGFGQVWATYRGARALGYVTVSPAQGALRFFPGVSDTTIEVGQSYRFRLAQYDTLGREQLDPRGNAMAISWWGSGKLDTIGLNLFELTPREPGRVEIQMFRGRRGVKQTVHVVPAVKAAPAAKPNVTPALVRPLPATVQIQVVDDISSPRPIPISIGARIVRTGDDGVYRSSVDTGTFVVAVHCPVPARLGGRVLRDTTMHFAAGPNPRMRIRVSSAKCADTVEREVTGTFTGHYRNGLPDETFVSCQPFQPISSAYGDSLRAAFVTIMDVNHTSKPVSDTTRYFAQLEGTLRGPGSFGTGGASLYYLRVTRVLELRTPTATDCR